MATDIEETAFLYTVPEPMPGGNSLPPGLVLDAMTGRIWGRLDPRASGAYTTDVIVDDLNGGVTTVTFDWTIADTNHPPFIDHYGLKHSYVGQSEVLGEALDIDSDDPQFTEATGLPPGAPSALNCYTEVSDRSDPMAETRANARSWRPKTHCLQFSVRTLLTVMMVMCLSLAWENHRATRQSKAVAKFRALFDAKDWQTRHWVRSEWRTPEWLWRPAGERLGVVVTAVTVPVDKVSDLLCYIPIEPAPVGVVGYR